MIFGQKSTDQEQLRFQTEWYEWTEAENIEGLRLALSEGQDIDEIVLYGRTALTLCAKKDLLRVFDFLREQGADLNKIDGNKLSPLMTAAFFNSKRVLQKLLSRNSAERFIETENEEGMTALHYAAMNGSAFAIEKLIQAGADVNCRDNKKRTPLHYCVCSGSPAAVAALMSAGADASAEDENGKTPDKMPGSIKAARDAISNGYLGSGGSGGGMSAAMQGLGLSGLGNLGGMQQMSGNHGMSASAEEMFEEGVVDDDIDVVIEALDTLGTMSKAGPSGQKPLEFAIAGGSDWLIKEIIDYAKSSGMLSAVINEDNGFGSPLHMAIKAGYEDIAIELLSCGADPKACDSHGQTAYDAAVAGGMNNLSSKIGQPNKKPSF